MQSFQVVKNFSTVVFVGIIALLVFFILTSIWIGYEVKGLCDIATSQYGGSCSQALVEQLNDTQQSYRKRNSAIWALGQIGNEDALSALKNFYTGEISEKEPLDQMLSQYELQKAITLISENSNLAGFIWKKLFNDIL